MFNFTFNKDMQQIIKNKYLWVLLPHVITHVNKSSWAINHPLQPYLLPAISLLMTRHRFPRFINVNICSLKGFPGVSAGNESACNAGDPGSIPRSGRSPGEGNGNPLQYSCLENFMDRGACPGGLQLMGLQSWTQLSD